jgi:hypothetical protein
MMVKGLLLSKALWLRGSPTELISPARPLAISQCSTLLNAPSPGRLTRGYQI